MDQTADVFLGGGGARGATAARLLRLRGHRVVLLETSPAFPFDPHILLPESALQRLQTLGVRQAAEAIGTRVRTSEIYWDVPDLVEPQGRSSALQIPERSLSRVLAGPLEADGVEVMQALARRLIVETIGGAAMRRPRVVGVELVDGRLLRGRMTLCARPSLFPAGARPRPCGVCDRATTLLLAGIDPKRFPDGHHFVEAFDSGWGWAIRRDGAHVQYTAFDDGDGRPMPDAPAGTSGAASDAAADRAESGSSVLPAGSRLGPAASLAAPALARAVCPTVPPIGWPAGVLPISRAAYALSPLTSLGAVHAMRTAYLAAAVAGSLMELPPGDVDAAAGVEAWYRDELTLGALRVHALTALACRAPARRFGTPFWLARSRDDWAAADVPEELVGAASRSREYLELSRSGEVLTVPMRVVPAIRATPARVQVGPRVLLKPGVAAEGGLPIPADDWQQLSEIADWYREGATLREVWERRLGHMEPGPEREALRKRFSQDVGRLYEHGILRRLDAGAGEPPP
jgi:hypothetical protein